MRLADKAFKLKKGRFFHIFLILVTCIVLNIVNELSISIIQWSGLLAYNSAFHGILVFFSQVISLSIFLVAYYTYPQIRNIRLLIAGFTFLTVGLIDLLNLIFFTDSGMLFADSAGYNGMGNADYTLIIWLVSRFINVIGFLFIVSADDKNQKEIKLRYLFMITFAIVAMVYGVICLLPGNPRMILEGKGLTLPGVIILIVAALLCIYTLNRSMVEYRKEWDTLYLVLSCVILLMFFSCVSLLKIRQTYDSWCFLSHLYQFTSCVLTVKVFYAQAIQRPYILLSKTKEELNSYLQELDRLVDKRTIELRNMNEKLLADQETARGMQLSMLPVNLPANDFVAFSAGYLPADNLSGDFYNVFKIDEERYGVCIGDVSGHGVSAAMLSIFTFQKMQSLMEESGGQGMAIPALVLKHLYDSFNAANFNEDMYIAMMYGVINIQTGIFSYASGGLNTNPLRIRPDGSIQELENDGFAICKLGDLLKPKFINHQILLFPGDKLVLYTDGLIDARNESGEAYSLQRLKEAILKHHQWGIEHMTNAVVNDVKLFSGESPADDITVLAVDILPPF